MQAIPPTVLVTGAGGFIGSHTTDLLLSRGHAVIGYDNLSTGSLANLRDARRSGSFRFVQADVLQPGRLQATIEEHGVEAVIHLAGLVSVVKAQEEPGLNFRLNVEATQTVLEACRRQGVRRLVFASSAAIYGDTPEVPLDEFSPARPISLYGAAKFASEKLIGGYAASFGLETVCLRYFNVFGPRQDPKSPYSGVISIFLDRFATARPVTVFGDGSQTRDFVSVYDVARANVLAATRPGVGGVSLNVCTGHRRSLQELLAVFRELHPESPHPIFTDFRPGEILHSGGRPGRAREVLGLEASMGLEEGIRDLVKSVPTSVSQVQL